MANAGDVKRWGQGTVTWNAWAESNPDTPVDFSGHVFLDEANFSSFKLPGEANFDGCVFKGIANFFEAEFLGDAFFRGVKFEDWAGFAITRFRNKSDFASAEFFGKAHYNEAEFADSVNFWESSFHEPTFFDRAQFVKPASFYGVRFGKRIDFDRASFRSTSTFSRATFSGGSRFRDTTFRERCDFSAAQFTRSTEFLRAHFLDKADFENAQFRGAALFRVKGFSGEVNFAGCEFDKRADFYGVEFLSEASFAAVTASGPFLVGNAKFARVPDFQDAVFNAPPRLDSIAISNQMGNDPKDDQRPWLLSSFRIAPSAETSSRFRRLKALAVEGQDHLTELTFFANEMLTRRFYHDAPTTAAFWLGVFYQTLADFGRNVIRPLACWAVGIPLFAALYGTRSQPSVTFKCNVFDSSLYVSFLNNLPIVGVYDQPARKNSLSCLFGISKTGEPLVSPIWDLMFLIQNSWSTLLLFLFFLGVRNRFKIS